VAQWLAGSSSACSEGDFMTLRDSGRWLVAGTASAIICTAALSMVALISAGSLRRSHAPRTRRYNRHRYVDTFSFRHSV
jgi:hypothetical protein